MASMATIPPATVPPPSLPGDSIWRAPLVPAALAITAGVVLDRYAAIPVAVSLGLAAVSLVAWGIARFGRSAGLALIYLTLAGVGFGAALYHARREESAPNDLANLAPPDPLPVQVRGVLDEEPHRISAISDPLRSTEQAEHTTTVLLATHLRDGDEWKEVTGLVLLSAAGSLPELHIGDEVEVTGRLSQLSPPSNPGEFDVAGLMRDQGVHCRLEARKTPAGVARLRRGWTMSWSGWLGVVRDRGQRELARSLPPETSGLAQALLLGEGSPLTAADWMKYVRTGVIHVLAISGQHLVVLALFLWWTLRLFGVRQRYGAGIVAVFLFTYAMLTGGRPPAMRSAVSGCAACLGLMLRRRTHSANLFALAWLIVVLLNPADVFGSGCQLSFLSVAVLHWGVGPLLNRRETDPLQQLIDEGRPTWLRFVRWFGRQLVDSYLIALAIWLAITPLAASRYGIVSPAGLILGPPLTLLTSLALLAGFLLLLLAPLSLPINGPLAFVVNICLGACEWLVDRADGIRGCFFYVGAVPEWWLWLFYLGLFAYLLQPVLRSYRRVAALTGVGWLGVGLLAMTVRMPTDELRVTFLAVGHGGCTALETADGRTFLYDAGALAGPDVARRQIAPFLWHQGVTRIDEVFLSHADLDHFNGLVGLSEQFAIGLVTCTPTFADKSTEAVRHTLAILKQRGIPMRIVKAGDRLTAGDVEMRVLHPPAVGPEGNENARSLVLEVRHAGHNILLTGDLEGSGLEMVVRRERRRFDVMMAPHHGSPRANLPAIAEWARPRVVVSCQGPPRAAGHPLEIYRAVGAEVVPTWPHGAVTVRSHASGLVIETFVTRKRLILRTERREE
jgi:competence protein ComEC